MPVLLQAPPLFFFIFVFGNFMRTSFYTTTFAIALTVASLSAPSLAQAQRFGVRSKPMAPASIGKAQVAPVVPKAPTAVTPAAAAPAATGRSGMMGTMGAAAVGAIAGSMAGNALAGAASDKEAKAKEAEAAEKDASELQRKADEARKKAEAARAAAK